MSQSRLPAADQPSRRRERPRSRARTVRRSLLAGLLVLVVGGGGTAWWMYQGLDSNLKEGAVDLDKALGDGKNRPVRTAVAGDATNLLVLGSDSRAGANAALDDAKVSGARSDTALLVHIAKGRTQAVAVSIPRDTLVTRPECTAPGGTVVPSAKRVMFNSVYSQVGSACTVKTVEAMSDVRVDHLIELDFAGFKELVDAVGGVTVTLDKPITKLGLSAGAHRLDGTESLKFVRTRYGYGDGSDLGRIGLQQRFMLALLSEIKRQGLLGSPTRLYRIADTLTESLTTDSGLASLTSLAEFGRSVQGIDPAGMETVMLPVAYDKVDPNRVVAVEPQADALWKAIRTDSPIPEWAKKSPAGGGS
ncbi:LCP family protein [Streptomyces turgidiscabies]|uniref:Putative transcriptional regulator n=1 Tax=Streptomyces turgidiscabies (strain Car8) TaxID=698760 RepID=L7FGC7_STRT8|nr:MULTISPECIES: LCP family protein [Streptomyces]ELP70239.1 putative transcriptional regulator [Streptomyces turgidiscabies Car8]MDX3495170.1 LCP family protein [Streptomyces turgidiscabies]GAQ71043.1 putative transcriptional regulator YwtF [Streptomyces turgidiscabies]